MTRVPYLCLALLASLLLGACESAPKPQTVEPWSDLQILGPSPSFRLSPLSQGWVFTATDGDSVHLENVRTLTWQGVPALGFDSGPTSYLVARYTNANLLVSPYLSWSWNMGSYAGGEHPLRILVGFQGGRAAAEGTPASSSPIVWDGSPGTMPPHDRVLALVWSDSALKRGHMVSRGTTPGFGVRGGRENASRWWLETADLHNIYRRAWPNDNANKVRIVFVGIGVKGTESQASGLVSGLQLTR